MGKEKVKFEDIEYRLGNASTDIDITLKELRDSMCESDIEEVDVHIKEYYSKSSVITVSLDELFKLTDGPNHELKDKTELCSALYEHEEYPRSNNQYYEFETTDRTNVQICGREEEVSE
jgi:hypothetical protein